ncbi:MAG: hypothetical protein ABGA11_03755 [Liquorilactobacillus hordei]
MLQCDDYACYNLLTDSITRVGCWAGTYSAKFL